MHQSFNDDSSNTINKEIRQFNFRYLIYLISVLLIISSFVLAATSWDFLLGPPRNTTTPFCFHFTFAFIIFFLGLSIFTIIAARNFSPYCYFFFTLITPLPVMLKIDGIINTPLSVAAIPLSILFLLFFIYVVISSRHSFDFKFIFASVFSSFLCYIFFILYIDRLLLLLLLYSPFEFFLSLSTPITASIFLSFSFSFPFFSLSLMPEFPSSFSSSLFHSLSFSFILFLSLSLVRLVVFGVFFSLLISIAAVITGVSLSLWHSHLLHQIGIFSMHYTFSSVLFGPFFMFVMFMVGEEITSTAHLLFIPVYISCLLLLHMLYRTYSSFKQDLLSSPEHTALTKEGMKIYQRLKIYKEILQRELHPYHNTNDHQNDHLSSSSSSSSSSSVDDDEIHPHNSIQEEKLTLDSQPYALSVPLIPSIDPS